MILDLRNRYQYCYRKRKKRICVSYFKNITIILNTREKNVLLLIPPPPVFLRCEPVQVFLSVWCVGSQSLRRLLADSPGWDRLKKSFYTLALPRIESALFTCNHVLHIFFPLVFFCCCFFEHPPFPTCSLC